MRKLLFGAVAALSLWTAQAMAGPIPYYTTPLSPADLQNILNNLITQINANGGGGGGSGMATNASNATAAALGNIVIVATGCGGTTNFVRADGTCQTPAGAGNVSTSGSITTGTLGVWASSTGLAGTQAFGATGNSTIVETDSGGHISNTLIAALPNANLANSSVTLNSHSLALGGSLTLQFTDFTGAITAAQMLPLALDNTYVGNSGSQPVATLLGSCSTASSALTYNNSTHQFGCNTISGASPTATIGATPVNGSLTTFMRSDAAPAIGANAVTNALLAQAAANTVKGNTTGANEADLAVPSCPDSAGNHLNWNAGTGFNCGSTSSGGGSGTPTFFVGAPTFSSNAYTLTTPTPNSFTLTDQYTVRIRVPSGGTNTGAATLNVAGTGPTAIETNTLGAYVPLVGGEISNLNEYDLTYNSSCTCFVLMNTASASAVSGATQIITGAKWAAGTVYNVTSSGQTLTLAAASALSANGGVFINTIGQSVTLAPNGTDNINGANASVTIPANASVLVTKDPTSGTDVAPSPTGVTAGSYPYVTVDAFGRVTAGTAAPQTVAHGGTGATTLTAHGVVVGEGASAVAAAGPGSTSGVPLIAQGASADPAFGTAVVAGGGTGAATLAANGVVVGEGTSAVHVAGSSSTADSALMWGAAAADPAPKAMPTTGTNGCSGASDALAYNTTTHVFSCNTISGGGGAAIGPAYVSNDWYAPYQPGMVASGPSAAAVNQTIYCLPGAVTNTFTVKALGYWNRSTTADGNVQVAIYHDASGRPGTVLAHSASIADGAGNGFASGAVSPAVSVAAGPYWWCLSANDTTTHAQYEGIQYTAGTHSISLAMTQGSPTNGGGINSSVLGISAAGQMTTFGTWPDLTGVTWTELTASNGPIVTFQAQ